MTGTYADRVADPDDAGCQHAGIEARPFCDAKALDEVALADVGGQRRARDARRRDLERDGPDRVAITNPDRLGAKSAQRKVLAERPGPQLAAQLGGPPGIILGAVHINGLIGPAVVLLIGHQIPVQPEQPDLGRRRSRLVDAGSGEP